MILFVIPLFSSLSCGKFRWVGMSGTSTVDDMSRGKQLLKLFSFTLYSPIEKHRNLSVGLQNRWKQKTRGGGGGGGLTFYTFFDALCIFAYMQIKTHNEPGIFVRHFVCSFARSFQSSNRSELNLDWTQRPGSLISFWNCPTWLWYRLFYLLTGSIPNFVLPIYLPINLLLKILRAVIKTGSDSKGYFCGPYATFRR